MEAFRNKNNEPLLRDMEILQRLERSIGSEETSTLLAVESLVHIMQAYSILFDEMSERLAPRGLSVAKLNLLIILYHAPHRHLPMSEIGARMSVTRTNITKLVDLLERDGLVKRQGREGDRRVVLAELTPRGITLLDEALPSHYASIRTMMRGLDEEECRRLTHLLVKLKSSIQADKSAPATSGVNHSAHAADQTPNRLEATLEPAGS